MKQDPGPERVAEPVSESHQMSRIAAGRRGAGLDLHANHLTAAQLAEDVEQVDAGRDPARLRRYFEAYALNTAGVVEDRAIYDKQEADAQSEHEPV